MYEYRRMTAARRAAAVAERKRRGLPWHGPPHLEAADGYRIVTGVCYEHRKLLITPQRLAWFEHELLSTLRSWNIPRVAWCILPNHYHVLVR